MQGGEFFQELGRIGASLIATDGEGKTLTIDSAVLRVVDRIRNLASTRGKLMFIGNGGSAAIASHQATDYWKCGGVRAVAFNDASLLTCIGNDYGYPQVFEKPVRMFADPGDVLFAVSSSGGSVNILNAARAAKELQCDVISLSGFSEENPLRRAGTLNFYVPSKRYGYVEVLHLAVLHCILDIWVEQDSGLGRGRGA